MDREAIMEAFGTCSGPDCLKDVVAKYGQRPKVYNAIKVMLTDCYQQNVSTCMVQIFVSLANIIGSLVTNHILIPSASGRCWGLACETIY